MSDYSDEARQFLRSRLLKDDLPQELVESVLDHLLGGYLHEWGLFSDALHEELVGAGLYCPDCKSYHRPRPRVRRVTPQGGAALRGQPCPK